VHRKEQQTRKVNIYEKQTTYIIQITKASKNNICSDKMTTMVVD